MLTSVLTFLGGALAYNLVRRLVKRRPRCVAKRHETYTAPGSYMGYTNSRANETFRYSRRVSCDSVGDPRCIAGYCTRCCRDPELCNGSCLDV